MKRQNLPNHLQQLSFSFYNNYEPVEVTENNTIFETSSNKPSSSADIININQVFVARKAKKDTAIYLRILESVKHIA